MGDLLGLVDMWPYYGMEKVQRALRAFETDCINRVHTETTARVRGTPPRGVNRLAQQSADECARHVELGLADRFGHIARHAARAVAWKRHVGPTETEHWFDDDVFENEREWQFGRLVAHLC